MCWSREERGEGGGWALGIREGTKAYPIKLENEQKKSKKTSSEDDSDSDYTDDSDYEDEVEEIPPCVSMVLPQAGVAFRADNVIRPPSRAPSRPVSEAVDAPQPSIVDPDLQVYRRREILEAIAARYRSNGLSSRSSASKDAPQIADNSIVNTNDEALALALQQEELGSDEEEADLELARALALSRLEQERGVVNEPEEGLEWDLNEEPQQALNLADLPSPTAVASLKGEESDESFELEEVSLVPSGRTTPQDLSLPETRAEETHSEAESPAATEQLPSSPNVGPEAQEALNNVDEALEEVKLETTSNDKRDSRPKSPPPTAAPSVKPRPPISQPSNPTRPAISSSSAETSFIATPAPATSNAVAGPSKPPARTIRNVNSLITRTPSNERPLLTLTGSRAREALSRQNRDDSPDLDHDDDLPDEVRLPHRKTVDPFLAFAPHNEEDSLHDLRPSRSRSASLAQSSIVDVQTEADVDEDEDIVDDDKDENDEEDEEASMRWSKSPLPAPASRPPLHTGQSGETIPSEVEDEDVDMASADMVAEEDDYARFLASIKNRDLNEVRTEIDEEIRVLNAANKVAMRDSDEISQAMISQIQVSHLITQFV